MPFIEFKTEGYVSGIQNKLPPEDIKREAGADGLSWFSTDGVLELVRGRKLIGSAGNIGGVFGEIFAPKRNGNKVHYRKTNTKIQYFDGTTWQDVITGLTAGSNYTFSSYISQLGAYVYASGIDGLYKIATANPASYKQMYDATKNYKGFNIINDQRMFMWNISSPNIDKTAVYMSKIDPQGTNYTTVTNENLGASGSTTYTGTLSAVTGTRFCRVTSITGTTGAGVETFTDNGSGVLTSDKGGTGTINYATGAYSITFNAVTTSGNVEADYQWEDSNSGGVTDFTFSSPRVAGEGDIIPQEYLGEPIQNILVFEGKYYSFKKTCVYELDLTTDDTNATNKVYRSDIGIPSMRSCISSGRGMVYLDTANPDKPILSILQRNPIGGNLEPVNLTPLFKWENYTFDECNVDTWGENIIVSAKSDGATKNDMLFLVNVAQNYSVDITYYGGNTSAKNEGLLYIGDSISDSVYQVFSGFDDLDNTIENYWDGKAEDYNSDLLKRFRYLRIKGLIDPAQSIEVWANFDFSGFTQLGTIVGTGSYVDYSDPQTIGANMLGTTTIGGGDPAVAYPYFLEIRCRVPKFRVRQLRFIAKGIGYASVQFTIDVDVLKFDQRIPSQFRQQQHVSLNGLQTNLPTFDH